jgi:hypothetical protein
LLLSLALVLAFVFGPILLSPLTSSSDRFDFFGFDCDFVASQQVFVFGVIPPLRRDRTRVLTFFLVVESSFLRTNLTRERFAKHFHGDGIGVRFEKEEIDMVLE